MPYGNFQGYSSTGVPVYGQGGVLSNLQGAPPFSYSPTAGGIPQVPSPGATQTGAIQSNLANIPGLTSLTQWANQLSLDYANQLSNLNRQQAMFEQQQNAAIVAQNNAAALAQARYMDELNRQQQRLQAEQYTPGLAGLEAASSQNIAAQLAGQVAPGTVNMLAQLAAQRGAGGGFGPRSPATNAALMRALGLTSEQQQQQGQANLSASAARTPGAQLYQPGFSTVNQLNLPGISAQPFNPASMFITPAEQQAAQYQANLLSAAPIPGMAQQANMQSLLAGLNQGYGRTSPGFQFGGMSPTSPAQEIFQRYSTPSQPTQQQAPAEGYYTPQPEYWSSADYEDWLGAGQQAEPEYWSSSDYEDWLYGGE